MWQARALSAGESWAGLASQRVLHARDYLPRQLCLDWSARVLRAEDEWTHDFDGEQFSLGLAYYTHHETGRTRHYFRDAEAANARVERILPGLQRGVVELVSALTGAPARLRPGWCGPGVHVFTPGSPVAERGGTVHFDLEGLREAPFVPAMSLVIVLQPAREGGGLRVWPARYAGAPQPSAAERAEHPVIVPYQQGDLIVFESQRLHQIEPFAGGDARISITAHALEDSGGWQVWF